MSQQVQHSYPEVPRLIAPVGESNNLKWVYAALTIIAVIVIGILIASNIGSPALIPMSTRLQPTAVPARATAMTAQPTTTAVPDLAASLLNCKKMDGMPTAAAGTFGAPNRPIVITFVPSGDVDTSTKAGTAIANCLSKITGLTYLIEAGTNSAASIEAMGSGHAQFGFLDIFSMLLAEAKYGIVPDLVWLGNYKGKPANYYQSQFIANNNSNIKKLADLKGKTFCFVAPNSTSGDIIPRIVLKASGIDPDTDLTIQYAGSHGDVAIAVYKGDCDAGATFVDVRTDSAAVKSAYPDILDKVSQFFLTDNIPNNGLQHINGLDQNIVDATVNGLLAIANDASGKVMLKGLYSYDGLAKIEPSFYDVFSQLLLKAGVNPATLVR